MTNTSEMDLPDRGAQNDELRANETTGTSFDLIAQAYQALREPFLADPRSEAFRRARAEQSAALIGHWEQIVARYLAETGIDLGSFKDHVRTQPHIISGEEVSIELNRPGPSTQTTVFVHSNRKGIDTQVAVGFQNKQPELQISFGIISTADVGNDQSVNYTAQMTNGLLTRITRKVSTDMGDNNPPATFEEVIDCRSLPPENVAKLPAEG